MSPSIDCLCCPIKSQSHNRFKYFHQLEYLTFQSFIWSFFRYNTTIELARSLLLNFFQLLISWTKPWSFQPWPLRPSTPDPFGPVISSLQDGQKWNRKSFDFIKKTKSSLCPFFFVHCVELEVAEDLGIHFVPKKTWIHFSDFRINGVPKKEKHFISFHFKTGKLYLIHGSFVWIYFFFWGILDSWLFQHSALIWEGGGGLEWMAKIQYSI